MSGKSNRRADKQGGKARRNIGNRKAPGRKPAKVGKGKAFATIDDDPFPLETLCVLSHGGHQEGDCQRCYREVLAFLSGSPHGTSGGNISPVVSEVGIRLNDRMTGEERNEFLNPLLRPALGTLGTAEHEQTRKYIVQDYAVRMFAPFRLRLAGRDDLAERLEALKPIADVETLRAARELTAQIRADAAAADAYDAYAAAYAYAAYADAYAAYADAYAAYAAYAAASPRLLPALARLRSVAGCVVGGGVGVGGDMCTPSEARRAVMAIAAKMLREVINVHRVAPKSWGRPPSKLPCLVKAA